MVTGVLTILSGYSYGQVWANDKLARGTLGVHDGGGGEANADVYMSNGSLYCQILDALGFPYSEGNTIPRLRLQKRTKTAIDENTDNVVQFSSGAKLQVSIAEHLSQWWLSNSPVCVSILGYEVSAHVHAAAVSVAAANVQQNVLTESYMKRVTSIVACHTVALAFLTDDILKLIPSAQKHIKCVLGAWAQETTPAKLEYAEAKLTQHGHNVLQLFRSAHVINT